MKILEGFSPDNYVFIYFITIYLNIQNLICLHVCIYSLLCSVNLTSSQLGCGFCVFVFLGRRKKIVIHSCANTPHRLLWKVNGPFVAVSLASWLQGIYTVGQFHLGKAQARLLLCNGINHPIREAFPFGNLYWFTGYGNELLGGKSRSAGVNIQLLKVNISGM